MVVGPHQWINAPPPLSPLGTAQSAAAMVALMVALPLLAAVIR